MRYAEYVQDLEYLPFPFEDLRSRLEAAPLKRWAFIVHGQDVTPEGTPRAKHVHVAMQTNSDQTPENIAKWFSDKPERIQYAKTKSHQFENMVAYGLHRTPTADGKYQYDPSEYIAPFDVVEMLVQCEKEIEEAKKNRHRIPLEPVLRKIANGEISRYRIDDYIDEIDQIKFAQQIERAYTIRDRRLSKESERTMEVVYMFGKSGTGKTTYAKYLAKSLKYGVFVTGSSNDPFQGYIGQECIILDDIRGSDWKMNDLLKVLDNNTASLAKSRYSNKFMKDCKLMILTSIDTLDDLYRGIKQSDNIEPIEQLRRRCGVVMELHESSIDLYRYDDEKRQHVFETTIANPVPMMKFAVANKSLIGDIIAAGEAMANEAPEGSHSVVSAVSASPAKPAELAYTLPF